MRNHSYQEIHRDFNQSEEKRSGPRLTNERAADPPADSSILILFLISWFYFYTLRFSLVGHLRAPLLLKYSI